MLKPNRKTWFFVADGAKARLFESHGPKKEWSLKGDWSNEKARAPARELGRDRPARGRNISTGAPYAIDTGSPHEKAEEEFLLERAMEISEAHKSGTFDQLLIAAPPGALGYLRKKLAPSVIANLIGALDKDLTNLSEHELHAYFVDKLYNW